MITTELEIANLALSRLGITKKIMSLWNASIDSSVEAEALRQVWTPCRRFLLAQQDWGFALKTCELTLIPDVLYSGKLKFKYAYILPERDPHFLIRISKVFDPNDPLQRSHQFQKQIIYTTSVLSIKEAVLTDVENAYCVGINSVTNPSFWDDAFISAFAYLLSSYIAQPLIGDISLTNTFFNMAMNFVSTAKYLNQSENLMNNNIPCGMIEARV